MNSGRNPGGSERKPAPGRSIRMQSIKCPTCNKDILYHNPDELPHFPFCSRKCKLIDLGMWFDEEHRISTPIAQAEREGDVAEAPEDEILRDEPEEDQETPAE